MKYSNFFLYFIFILIVYMVVIYIDFYIEVEKGTDQSNTYYKYGISP